MKYVKTLKLNESDGEENFSVGDLVSIKNGIFFLACIFAPLWEEAVFRYFPIQWAYSMGNMLTPMIVMSSMIFGIMHGSILNILFQGVGGLIISWVYLKNGSYWWSVFSHALWNTMIIFAIPLLS